VIRRAHVPGALRLLALALAVALPAACGGPASSVGPLGACGDDARGAGAYPDLEQGLPTSLNGRAPDLLDSGRSCSAQALATYASHGIREVRYAGATWTEGAQDGTVIADFVSGPDQPPLDRTWVQEFYESGARASTKTENIEITMPQLPEGGRYWRLQTLNDLSLQTVAVWGGDPGIVHVVIVATQVQPGASRAGHNDRVDRAIQAVLDREATPARTAREPVLVSAA
jgi:hypothetical protein